MPADTPKLSIVLFSGTDDRLQSAAVLIAGAAAMGRSVDVLLQFWALDAFRADRIRKDHGVAPEGGVEGAAAMRRIGDRGGHWADTVVMAKEVGDVSIHACAHSTELLGISKDDLDPVVDDIEGMAAFIGAASGSVLFI